MSPLSSGVQLQHAVKGAASAEVRFLENAGRNVVWVDIDAEYHRGALSAEASGVIANAAAASDALSALRHKIDAHPSGEMTE